MAMKIDDLLNKAPCGFIRFDDNGTILIANLTLTQLLGYERGELEGRHIETILSVAGRIFYQTHLFPLLKLHAAAEEIYLSLRPKDGSQLPVLLNAARREYGGEALNDCVILVMRQRHEYEDVILQAKKTAEAAQLELAKKNDLLSFTNAALQEARAALQAKQLLLESKQADLQKANAQLEALATTDGLTGVKNRRAFEERLTEEINRSVRYKTLLSLVLLDVDKFKQYNDTYGHQSGDEVLKTVARLLQENTRTTDLVARYGGEEFVLVLPSTPAASAMLLVERLRRVIESAPWPERPVTASFGVATVNDEIHTAAALIGTADRALYAAKDSGRNRAVHAQSLEGERPSG